MSNISTVKTECLLFEHVKHIVFINDIEHFPYYIIVVCIYRLVMISIDLSDTTHCVHWKSETMSETKFFSDNFFSNKVFF